MQILDGKTLAQKIEKNVASEVVQLKENTERTPGLAVILVGQDPASVAYVNMKKKACDRKTFHKMP